MNLEKNKKFKSLQHKEVSMEETRKQEYNEIVFLNIAKTISIFLVALAHLSIPEEGCILINAFHMPVFFFISGYLFHMTNNSFTEFLIKKIRTLICPYFIFAILGFLFWFFIGRKYGHDASQSIDVSNYLKGIFLAIPSKDLLGFNLPIWFLPSLFCVEIMFYICHRWLKGKEWLIAICLFLCGILFVKQDVRLLWGLDVTFFSFLFITMGFFTRQHWHKFYPILCFMKHKIWLFLPLLFILLYLVSSQNGLTEMYRLHLGNYILFICGAVLGILITILLSLSLPDFRFWSFYGRNTIIILGLHLISFSFIKAIQLFVFRYPLDNTEEILLVNILYVCLSFALLSPVIYILNHYFPFLLGRKAGVM